MTLLQKIMVVVAAIAIGFIVAKYTIKSSVITNTVYTQGRTDTTYLPSQVLHDTLRITKVRIDTVDGDIISAIDTTFRKDSSSIVLGVVHHSAPNFFLITADWDIRERLIMRVDTVNTTTVITLSMNDKWWSRINLGVGVGATYENGQVKAFPSLGIYYRIF